MKVLVTGARGQLAGAIVDAFRDTAEVVAYARQDLDIADHDEVMARVDRDRPDVILNCASFNYVDRAEDEAETALNVNAFGVRSLARAAADTGAALVHYSTDFVFDGTASRPYSEEDAPNPQSLYAQSKLLGEWFALEAPRAFVLRVESLFGGTPAKSSVDGIIRAIAEDREIAVFLDRTVTPSYVVDVGMATRFLIGNGTPGIYHCVGTGVTTWYELAREIARVLGKSETAKLEPVSVDALNLRARRPKYAALSNEKIARLVPMPTWQDALQRYLA